MPDDLWAGKRADLSVRKPDMTLANETYNYINIKCSTCPYRDSCTYYDPSNGGCGMRKSIYERLFSPIEFKTDDPIAVNRLRLTSYHFVEIMLMRSFGDKLTAEELVALKTVLSELGKLYIDKRGDMIDQKSRAVVPWETSPQVDELRRQVEEARAAKEELAALKIKIAESRKKPVSDEKSG